MISDIKRHFRKKGVKTSFLIVFLINVISSIKKNGFSFTTLLFSIVAVSIGFLLFSRG